MTTVASVPSSAWPDELPISMPSCEESLCDHLARSAQLVPEKVAVSFGEHGITYSELRDRADAVAAWLENLPSFLRGDRVLLLVPNGTSFAIAYHGILRAGGVVVPSNVMNTASDLEWLASDSGASVVISDPQLAVKLAQVK